MRTATARRREKVEVTDKLPAPPCFGGADLYTGRGEDTKRAEIGRSGPAQRTGSARKPKGRDQLDHSDDAGRLVMAPPGRSTARLLWRGALSDLLVSGRGGEGGFPSAAE